MKVLAPQLEYSVEDARMAAVGKEAPADDLGIEAPEGKDWVGGGMVVAGVLEVGAEAWGHSLEKEDTLSSVLETATSMVQSDGASAEDEIEGAVKTGADSATAVVDVDGAGNQGFGVEIAVETAAVVGNAAVVEGGAGTGEEVEGEEADGRAVPVAATAPAWVAK